MADTARYPREKKTRKRERDNQKCNRKITSYDDDAATKTMNWVYGSRERLKLSGDMTSGAFGAVLPRISASARLSFAFWFLLAALFCAASFSALVRTYLCPKRG